MNIHFRIAALASFLVLSLCNFAIGQTVEPQAAGQTAATAVTYAESVLYTFTGGTLGGAPYAGLVMDQEGNLYGTTSGGGGGPLTNGSVPAEGAVFEITAQGKGRVLHSFTGLDGFSPSFFSQLIRDEEGNLYGVTEGGGPSGFGTVFRVNPDGEAVILHAFTGTSGGAQPMGTLVHDAAGNLFGTATYGGKSPSPSTNPCGIVFQIEPKGRFTVLYTFEGEPDGCNPYGSLARDPLGNLYGTTYSGGANELGTVFQVSPRGSETVLHSFNGRADGSRPLTGVIRDSAGNLYGTASGGGHQNGGVVFKLDSTGTETTLYNFTGGLDGTLPYSGLLRDPSGNLYGTTYFGGTTDFGGVVFKVDPNGNETVLYNFTLESDGGNPYSSLVMDKAGNLYGTTSDAGNYKVCEYGCGTVFKLSPK